MKTHRPSLRVMLAALSFGAAAALLASPAAAAFPDKPIQLVSPYSAGGGADTLARLLGQKLSEQLGVPIIVENKPGAGTAIGATAVAKARPDGYTLLLSASSTFTINPAIMPKLTYDPASDFEPIGQVGSVALALAVHADVKAKSVKELVEVVHAKPDGFVYSSFGNGTAAHFGGEMFNAAANVDILHIPYRGSSQAMTDLVSGQVPVGFDTVVALAPYAKSGKLAVLAVLGDQRSAQLPDVPTMAESGYPEVNITPWIALVGPTGLPPDVHAKLQAALAAVMADEDTQHRIRTAGFEVDYQPLANWKELVQQDTARMRGIAERAKIVLE